MTDARRTLIRETLDKVEKRQSPRCFTDSGRGYTFDYYDPEDVEQLVADLLSTQQEKNEPHRCARCGHRWEGPLSGAEYCGDCHRAAQARQGWQPMETAPKDGTVFLGWSLEWALRMPELVVWLDGRIERAGWYTYQGPHRFVKQPTHWMPLPAPPAAQEGTD